MALGLLAIRLPGRAGDVWTLVHHLARLSRASRVTVPSRRLTECGIAEATFRHALRHLEKAGLILVHKQGAGRSVVIELIELADGDREEDE